MNNEQSFHSDFVIHPGKTLLENLEFLCISQKELAERSGISAKHISNIVNEKASITPGTALKLEKIMGISAGFWNNLEKNYHATLARIKAQSEAMLEENLLSDFRETFQELVRLNLLEKERWIEKNFSAIIFSLQSFFGVDSLRYVKTTNLECAYRKYENKKTNENTVAAWLRIGQIQAQKSYIKKYDEKKLEKKSKEIRSLCESRLEDVLPTIKSLLAECGVVLVCAPYLKNTYTQGAVQWVSPDKVLIILKTTSQSADRVWFNLFHEIAHILKHGKSKTFIDLENKLDSTEEKEADEFAQNVLLPNFSKNEISAYSTLAEGVSSLAKKYKVSKSIIAGRLSHEYKDEKSVYKQLNPFIERINCCDI